MNIIPLVLIFSQFLILSCIPSQNRAITLTNSKETNDTIIIENDKYLFFENITDSTYSLIWGNKSIKNTSKDTLHILPNGKATFGWVSNKAICIKQGCGSSCFYAYILPFSSNTKEKFYMYPLAYDTINNLIAYGNDNNNPFITIDNFLTGKKMNINEDFLPGPFTGFCIDTIQFKQKGLFIQWKNKEEVTLSKFFNIESLIN